MGWLCRRQRSTGHVNTVVDGEIRESPDPASRLDESECSEESTLTCRNVQTRVGSTKDEKFGERRWLVEFDGREGGCSINRQFEWPSFKLDQQTNSLRQDDKEKLHGPRWKQLIWSGRPLW